MLSALTAFCISVAVVIAMTPLVRRFALNVGAVDRPSERRVHERLVPRLGGIALVIAFFAPLLTLFALETEASKQFFSVPSRITGLVLGGLIVMGLGVLDDLRGVGAWSKLWSQIGAAAVAYACHYRIEAVAVPWLGNLEMGIFAFPVTALWIVGVINAINLIDGLDGLAGGVAFFACVTNFVVGAINHDVLVMLLSASLGGALLGFLLYNFNPASIFMGDSGSMFLGFVLATTSILGNSVKSSTTVALFVPLIALGLPIVDTFFAMLRRFLERRPIFAADRGHIHHRLLAMGINQRRAVLILYGCSIVLTAGSILLSMGRNWQVGGALLVLSMAAIGVVRAFGDFQAALVRYRRRERVRAVTTERLRGAMPELLQHLYAGCDIDMAQALTSFGVRAQLSSIELGGSDDERLPCLYWTTTDPEHAELRTGQHRVAVSFPLPEAGSEAFLRFTWGSEQYEVSAEADILLQLVVDACAARVTRVALPQPAQEASPKGRLRSI